MNESEVIHVEVAYALPDQQLILELDVPVGTSVEQAIKESAILDSYPEINLEKNKVGIFGKLTKLVTELKAGDRVEIYRPLIADPKEVRRQREAEGKRMKKGSTD
ncbi:MAG: RnfH family protein [Gammaproteobacteria bacterium]|nr:RnfH family protein [Gammaproteobacteria bacterium]MCW8911075.1 RnfH family protein [Gammaproteobacteria bacterium]MCW9005783.1 RnfH family protein [Gammaproteobacteria bacterium]